jgi:transcriptional regulator with GAF, ATPase, and Fis domain
MARGLARPAPLGAVIRVVGSRAHPPTYRLTSGKCVIGSAPGSQIVILSDPTVSRSHVELELLREGVRVRDLQSRNGTFYKGQRIEAMVLALGGRLKLGATEITVDADTDSLERDLVHSGESFRGMIGRSLAMRRLFAILSRLEGSLVAVLVTGESGVGKELVARAIHDGSSVSEGPLTIVNCGAIPRDLVASELFGHKRGAFTGAVDTRAGAFESAHEGTLFLDEVGELPIDVQPALLRALESGEVRPVGGDIKHVRVRVVAATNRNLEDEMRAGRFREDLYYRLAVVKLHVPPLRERPEDIEPIARAFARNAGVTDLPAEVVDELGTRSWPGNARELRNVIAAFGALGTLDDQTTAAKESMLDYALRRVVDVDLGYAEQKNAISDRFTRVFLEILMERTKGNQTAAARLAGIDRGYLGKLLAKHGLSHD